MLIQGPLTYAREKAKTGAGKANACVFLNFFV